MLALERARAGAAALAQARMAADRSRAFAVWFGNSKEIDDEGKPRVFYHATNKHFDTFKPGGDDPKVSGAAIWLSPYAGRQPAAHNVGGSARGFKEGTHVMPLYVRMERPLLIDDQTMLASARDVFAGGSREFPQILLPDWIKAVREEYDGIILSAHNGNKENDGENEEHIVFDASQVKSATGNSGSFDRNSASLLDAAWELFDGPVQVTTAMLDAADETVQAVTRALVTDLLEATAALAQAKTPFQRMALAERVRTLARRIDLRKGLAPVRLQNRDRSTAASIAQVMAIGANPDPDLLGYSKTATDGAPIVFSDYDEVRLPAGQMGRRERVTFAKDMSKIAVQFAVVDCADVMVSHDANGAIVPGYDAPEAPGKLRAVAGNGRAAGIQLAYANARAAGYKAGLLEDADLLKLDAKVLEAMPRPMLVRIMLHVDVTADIGDKTNAAGTAALSASEQAKTDGDRIDFDALTFTDDGVPTADALVAFVRSMPVAEQALLAPDGAPTTQALDRMMAATFNRAYRNDDLVKLYSQSIDPEIKNVLFGMAQAAGDMAALAGKGDYDIRAFVTDAATMASNAKRAGLPLSRMAEQRDMAMAEETNDIAGMLARNARSAKKIGEALRTLARSALAEANDETEDMFGPKEKRTPAALVQAATAD